MFFRVSAVFVALLLAIGVPSKALESDAEDASALVSTDLTEFSAHVQPFLEKHCVQCHGEKKQKADFFLHNIDGLVTGGKDVVRWEKILEMISLGDMPPEDEEQPPKIDKAQVVTWIAGELGKIGRGLDEGKLALPHQANRIDHDDLFSGEHQGPAYSPSRLWRKSPQIYKEFSREVRTEVSQPLLGLGGKGIQDYASLIADESTIKTMLRNSNLIAESLLKGKKARFRNLLDETSADKSAEHKERDWERGMRDLFQLIFQRDPTEEDRQRSIEGLFRKNAELGGNEIGMRTLIVGMLMSREFVFRMEVGLGERMPDGRRMLSPEEIAYALSFAFFDKPDRELFKAAAEGKLSTKEDVEREVRSLLAREDAKKNYWHYPMYHQWGGDYYHHQPRVLRFFQEFFGYTAVVDVFKDRERNHDHHALRLRKDADLFVLSILEKDKDVLKELLTSNRYVMDYFRENKMKKLLEGNNERKLKHLKEQYGDKFDAIAKAGKWPGIDTRHVSAYNISHKKAREVRRDPGELIQMPKHERAGMLTHPAWLVAHSGNFDNDPIRRGKWIREHLLADLIPDVPIGVDAKVPEDPQRTLRERLDIVRKAECWRCHKQMNPLGIAFETYDDFGRFREQILIGDADAYIKERRKYDGQKANWEKELAKWIELDAEGRREKVKEAEERLAGLKQPDKSVENYPARKRQYEGDVNRWTKERAHWSTVTDVQRDDAIAGLKRRLAEMVPPVPEAKPVDAHGVLRGTGDASLDGPVSDAIDLVHRLAQSEKVRQSFVRHVFRYWMGRNESLQDSPTLIAADQAYVKSGGSFRELLVSLLTSDSFLYRK